MSQAFDLDPHADTVHVERVTAELSEREMRLQLRDLRVAVVHDYLTQRGGAERVVLAMMKAFPHARLITSAYDAASTFPEFAEYDIQTTWLGRVPLFRRDPRMALPLLAGTFSAIKVRDVDVVIVSSSGWAHGVTSTAPKIVYCHNPARWLYQQDQYLPQFGLGVQALIRLLSPVLRRWDRRAAASVATYFANSRVVADRILREYGRTAKILPPPVMIDTDGDREPVQGLEPGFLLTVSRNRGYKNSRIVCEAVEGLENERLVVVGGLPEPTGGSAPWSARLLGLVDVPDAQLRWLYANCSALVAASHEDFGLTPLEGNAFGRPAVVLRAGGYLDTLVEGHTGVFIEELDVHAVRQAILDLRQLDLDSTAIEVHAEKFGFDAFRGSLAMAARKAVGG